MRTSGSAPCHADPGPGGVQRVSRGHDTILVPVAVLFVVRGTKAWRRFSSGTEAGPSGRTRESGLL